MMRAYFENQTKLLLKILGTVVSDDRYALKGGTAINFFHSNMPRLSVDIDLCFTEVTDRAEFNALNEHFHVNMVERLKGQFGLIPQIKRTSDQMAKQITVTSNDCTVKVETNLVLRGTVYPPELRDSCEKIETQYGVLHTIRLLSLEDLYAGKICAALDRQHPRDLFDVMEFFKKHTFDRKLKKAFIVYLLSGNRPISELINPNRLNQTRSYENEFQGMTDVSVSYQALEETREHLIHTIDESLDDEDRKFLISFKEGNPDWSYFELGHIPNLPAVKWKQYNIQKMNHDKHQQALLELKKKLKI